MFVVPASCGFMSKLVSMAVTYPLEYMATLSQAKLMDNKKVYQNGFGYTLYRELVYSACFWGLQDRFLVRTKGWYEDERQAFVAASFMSSIISASISYPFDLFKTWKISYPEKFADSNWLKVTQTIFREQGLGVIMVGRPLSQRSPAPPGPRRSRQPHLLLRVHQDSPAPAAKGTHRPE